MSLFKSTPKIKVGDKVTLTGTVTDIGPSILGSDTIHALILLDTKLVGERVELRIDMRILDA
jgi:hypothetical protein